MERSCEVDNRSKSRAIRSVTLTQTSSVLLPSSATSSANRKTARRTPFKRRPATRVRARPGGRERSWTREEDDHDTLRRLCGPTSTSKHSRTAAPKIARPRWRLMRVMEWAATPSMGEWR